MKFGKLLKLGMYSPWAEHYIAYDRLKRLIDRKVFLKKKMEGKKQRKEAQSMKEAEKKKDKEGDVEAPVTELTPLTQRDSFGSHSEDRDYSDNRSFMSEIDRELVKINKFFDAKVAELRVQLDELVEKWKEQHSSHHNTHLLSSHLVEFRRLYQDLSALEGYGPLNRTGFYKIIKKYDKNLGENNMKPYMQHVDLQNFVASKEPTRMIDVIAGYVSRSKLVEWKHATQDVKNGEAELFPSLRPHALALSIFMFVLSFQLPDIAPGNENANRCLSLLLLVISLWLTNALPYFATAMLVPVLIPLLGVMRVTTESKHGVVVESMPADMAAKFILNNFFNHTTILLFGGYTLSSALSRCQFELRVAAWLQKKLGHSPNLFLLSIMFFSLFLSLIINNHTSPILVAAVLRPIVQDLDKDSRFAKALLLGLAMSSNFGGIMSPISSLQNILAVSNLEKVGIEISFLDWMLVSVPLASVLTFVSWALICFMYPSGEVTTIPFVIYDRENRVLSARNVIVLMISFLTLVSFASFDAFKPFFGDVGMVALLYATIMFGSGILTELDFNSLSWHTLILLAGGDALGKAVHSSGLLLELSKLILSGIPADNEWMALCYVLVFASVVATFVSHTVASMILIPMITQVSVNLHMPGVMIIGVAFTVSSSMALPFSSFPNVNSAQILDDFQAPYLRMKDFLKIGLPLTIISIISISTAGAFLIRLFLDDVSE